MKASFIVIEGIDGAGKTTQVEHLKYYLALQGVPLEAISFPRYEDNLYGKLIKKYLEGEFGANINPYLIALAYAGDRSLAKSLIESWLNKGKVVIANRYVSSSKAHLGANLPEYQREEFMGWVDELEYQTNGLPKPDLTILLEVNPQIGQSHVSGDLHEDSLKHLEQAAKIYSELSQAEENWQVVNCMENDKMQSRENIHKKLTALVDKLI